MADTIEAAEDALRLALKKGKEILAENNKNLLKMPKLLPNVAANLKAATRKSTGRGRPAKRAASTSGKRRGRPPKSMQQPAFMDNSFNMLSEELMQSEE
ncbi:MAG: hypothetical protein HWD59_03240 [Coxiellaceae bacterium]|nr:MAG: hypothetical protein HWD59_03240 [Coxiellaceae bacterium]